MILSKVKNAAGDLSTNIDSNRENSANTCLFLAGAAISILGGFGVPEGSGLKAVAAWAAGKGGATAGIIAGLLGLGDKFDQIEMNAGDTVTIQLNTTQQYDGTNSVGSPTDTFILRVYDKDMNLKYEENYDY